MMKACALCGSEVETDKFFSRKSECPSCGGDLHICLNCRFHSPSSHNQCVEPKAEFQRSRDKANYCEYFSYREGTPRKKGARREDAADDARRKLDDLFRK